MPYNGPLVRRDYKPGVSGEQPTKFRQEISWAFKCLDLNMGIGPRLPWFIYVLVFGSPLSSNLKGNTRTQRGLFGECLIVANGMMRLTVPRQMPDPQIVNGYATLKQTPYMPDGKIGLLERACLGPVVPPVPIAWTNETANDIVLRNRHGLPGEPGNYVRFGGIRHEFDRLHRRLINPCVNVAVNLQFGQQQTAPRQFQIEG